MAGAALWAAALGRRRSFRADALRQLAVKKAELRVDNPKNAPAAGPAVILVNHYHRPGFGAWWISLAISALVPMEVLWVMTAAWTDMGGWLDKPKAWLSERLFPRLAAVYGFTSMPPMPPRSHEAGKRVLAVRRALAAARLGAVLGLSPEGQDPPPQAGLGAGVLMRPPAGVGRFVLKLARSGCALHPVGFYEDGQALVVSFGERLVLECPPSLDPQAADRWAARQVMRAIGARLPEQLRGEFV